jgi:hypothetical protein
MPERRDKWLAKAFNAVRVPALLALMALLSLVLWAWVNKLPPEVLGTMCGHNVCMPLVVPVSAASSPAGPPAR